MNKTLLGAVLAIATLCVQCSLLLDLPADCRPDDCGGYACNDEGTGCRFQCGDDGDCAGAHLCDGSACIDRGCDPTGAVSTITDSAGDRQIAAAWGDGKLGVVWVDAGRLQFQVFQGEALEPGGGTTLDQTHEPERPSLTWNGNGWGVSWEGRRAQAEGGNETLNFATVDVMGQQVLAPRELWVAGAEGGGEKSVDSPDIAWHEAAQTYVLVWSTQITFSDIYMIFVRRDGTDAQGRDELPHDAALRVSQTSVDTVAPLVSPRAEGVYDIVFRQGSTTVDTVLRTVNERAAIEGSDINLSRSAGRIDDHGYQRTKRGSVAGFTEQGTSRGRTYRTQLTTDRTIAGDSRLEVDRDFVDSGNGHVASAQTGEYAIIMDAVRNDRRDVYLARFRDNGSRIGVPFSVTDDRDDASHPLGVATPNGYILLHHEGTSLVGRHWTCTGE
jgi:hypothetical protein